MEVLPAILLALALILGIEGGLWCIFLVRTKGLSFCDDVTCKPVFRFLSKRAMGVIALCHTILLIVFTVVFFSSQW